MATTALIITSKAGGERGSLTTGLGTIQLNGRFQICMHDATRCRSVLALRPTFVWKSCANEQLMARAGDMMQVTSMCWR